MKPFQAAQVDFRGEGVGDVRVSSAIERVYNVARHERVNVSVFNIRTSAHRVVTAHNCGV
jgi:hypothetical protein